MIMTTGTTMVRLTLAGLLVWSSRATAQAAPPFPASWIGRWAGTLTTIAPPDSVRNRIPIALENRYTLRRDTVVHELTWWDTSPTRTMKGSGANADGGAEVRSFRV